MSTLDVFCNAAVILALVVVVVVLLVVVVGKRRRLCLSQIKPRFETLSWLIRHRRAVQYLMVDKEALQASVEESDLSHNDISRLTVVAVTGPESDLFWTKAALLLQLADWGWRLTRWLRGCSCHKGTADVPTTTTCKLKGRRGIALAAGKMKALFDELSAISPSTVSIEALSRLPLKLRSHLMLEFATAKKNLQHRASQLFGFWQRLPWRILAIGEFLLYENEPATLEEASLTSALDDERDGLTFLSLASLHSTEVGGTEGKMREAGREKEKHENSCVCLS
jgi:hypothetical protein